MGMIADYQYLPDNELEQIKLVFPIKKTLIRFF